MATAKKAPAKKAPAKEAAPAKKVVAKKAASSVPAKKAASAEKSSAPAKKAAAKKSASTEPAKKRTPNAAFMKALTLSPELSAVVGDKPLPRTEIVSKLWIYIKEKNLQDKLNKRMINADAKLRAVFGKDQVSMFEMAGLINKHAK